MTTGLAIWKSKLDSYGVANSLADYNLANLLLSVGLLLTGETLMLWQRYYSAEKQLLAPEIVMTEE